MKYLLSVFWLLFIILFASNAYAASTPDFPSQVGDYRLVTSQPHVINYEPKECLVFTDGANICQDYWTAAYKSTKGDMVFVHLGNISSGYDVKKSRTLILSKGLPSEGVYLDRENKVEWFTGNSKISSYKFNYVVIAQANVNYIGNDSYSYDYWSTSPSTTDIYKHFVKNFPPEKLVANTELINNINNPDTNAFLIFKNIKSYETFIAGKEYKILMDNYNISPDVKIYFELSYINQTNGKMENSSVQIIKKKNKQGEYVWKVPANLAYGDKNSTDNYIYRIRAAVPGLNGKMLYETQTPVFRVVSKGNKKSEITFTEFPDNATYFKGGSVDIKWVPEVHIDRYEIDLVSKRGNKNKGTIYDSFATEDFPNVFKWIPDSDLKKDKYYFHIRGYTKGKNVSEGKSKVFEIK